MESIYIVSWIACQGQGGATAEISLFQSNVVWTERRNKTLEQSMEWHERKTMIVCIVFLVKEDGNTVDTIVVAVPQNHLRKFHCLFAHLTVQKRRVARIISAGNHGNLQYVYKVMHLPNQNSNDTQSIIIQTHKAINQSIQAPSQHQGHTYKSPNK